MQVSHVVPFPPLVMALLEHHPAQCTKEQCPTPVTVDTGSPMESPQQRLPVWLMGPGGLYQLVNVCELSCYSD